MTNQSQKHEGGLLAPAQWGDSHYRHFEAFQVHISRQTSIVGVVGEVLVANPGVEVTLFYAVPQGPIGENLLLRIEFYQRPGIWPHVQTWKPVAFYRMGFDAPRYQEAEIVSGEVMVVRLPVRQAFGDHGG